MHDRLVSDLGILGVYPKDTLWMDLRRIVGEDKLPPEEAKNKARIIRKAYFEDSPNDKFTQSLRSKDLTESKRLILYK